MLVVVGGSVVGVVGVAGVVDVVAECHHPR